MPFGAIGKGLLFSLLILNWIFILYLYLYSSSASLFLKTSDRKHTMYSVLMRDLETGDNIFMGKNISMGKREVSTACVFFMTVSHGLRPQYVPLLELYVHFFQNPGTS